jgi:hypothetical protein
VILALLGVFLSGLPALFAVPAERLLFQPQPYQQALEQQKAYERFPQMVGEILEAGGDRFLFGSGGRLREALDRSHYQTVVQMIFPESWLRDQADGLLVQFWDFFNFKRDTFTLRVDLRPVKARLEGEPSAAIGAALVAGLPGCTDKDLLAFGLSALQGTLDQIPLCRPPQMFQEVSNLLAAGLLKSAGAAMPQEIDLTPALQAPARLGGKPIQQAWKNWFEIYRAARGVSPWLPWLALFFLILTGVLGRGTARGSLFWLGAGLILPGTAGGLIALILWLASAQAAPLLVSSLLGNVPVIYDVLVGVLKVVLGNDLQVTALTGLAVTAVGALLVVVAFRRTKLSGDKMVS